MNKEKGANFLFSSGCAGIPRGMLASLLDTFVLAFFLRQNDANLLYTCVTDISYVEIIILKKSEALPEADS